MNRNKLIFIAAASFILVLSFVLLPDRVRAGCAAGYYCYGTSVVDNYKCNPTPIDGVCGAILINPNSIISCDSNCSFQYCSSNDDIICKKETSMGVSYCVTTNCNTAGNCCALGGPTPEPPPPPPPPPSGITMNIVVGLDKNRNGVFDDGYYQVIEDPGDVNCGTFPNISGLVVNYSGAATGSINYHTSCIGGAYNYPYSTQAIPATGNFTFALANLPSNYTLKWTEEATGKCTLSGGVVNCNGLVGGQTYALWFLLQEAPTCTVQGYKVVMPGNVNTTPASTQTVTLNDPATSTSTQPYFLNYQSAGKTRTVSVSVPAGYTVGYTLCYNNTNCHTNAPVMSNTVSLPDNSFCGSGDGYADLWWHYYPPAVPNCKNLTGPAALYVGETGTFSAMSLAS